MPGLRGDVVHTAECYFPMAEPVAAGSTALSARE
jgi:hypothetical protein